MGMYFRLPDPSSDEQHITQDGIQKLEREVEKRNETNPYFRYRLVLEVQGDKKVLTCRQLTWSEIVGGGKSTSNGKTTTAKLTDITHALHEKFPYVLKSSVDKFIDKKIGTLAESTNQKLQEAAELVGKFNPAAFTDEKLKILMGEAFYQERYKDAFTFLSKLSHVERIRELVTIIPHLTGDHFDVLQRRLGAFSDDMEDALSQLAERKLETALAEGTFEEADAYFKQLNEETQNRFRERLAAKAVSSLIKSPQEREEVRTQRSVFKILDQIEKGHCAKAKQLISELGEIAFTDPEIRGEVEKKIVEVLTKAITSQEALTTSNALDLIEKMNPNMLSAEGWLKLLHNAIVSKNEELANRISSKMGSQLADNSTYRICLLAAVEKKWKAVALNLLQKIPREAFNNDSAMLPALDPLIRDLSNLELRMLKDKVPQAVQVKIGAFLKARSKNRSSSAAADL